MEKKGMKWNMRKRGSFREQTDFDRVHLQWFAKEGGEEEGVPDLEFEEEEEDELDFSLEGEEGEEEEETEPTGEEDLPEEVRGKSKAELAAEIESLRGQTDQAAALQRGIEALGEKLATPQRSAQATTQDIKKALAEDPEFRKKFNEDIFKDDPMGALMPLIEDVAERIANKRVQAVLGPYGQSTLQMAKQSLMNDPKDGPIFKMYENEIEHEIMVLDEAQPGVKNDPRVYKHVLDQIKLRHLDDIAEMRAEEKLKAQANGGKGKGKEAKPQFSERGGAPAPRSKVKKVVVTRWEQELCNKRGIDPADYARMKKEGSHFDEKTHEFVEA